MSQQSASAMVPTQLTLHSASRNLEIDFPDGAHFTLPCEYLRVFSPSAEVRGHGGGPMVTLAGKRLVNITAIDPVGRYALRLTFDDGHNSGLYSWQTLYELGRDQEANWQDYLDRLMAMGASRDP